MERHSNRLDPDAIILLRERYGYLRAEILQRLDNRYKLLTALLALVGVGFTVAVQLKWDAVALPVCATMLVLAIVLQGENRHVQLISDYLITIERELDEHYQLQVKGWERFSRRKRGDKNLASNRLTFGALAFLTIFYIVFGAIGVRWAVTSLGKRVELSSWPLIAGLSAVVIIPLVFVLSAMWLDYRRLWRNTTR